LLQMKRLEPLPKRTSVPKQKPMLS
jgi:hypothetical protein